MKCLLYRPAYTPCRPLFKDVGILSLPSIYLYQFSISAHQNLIHLDNNYKYYKTMITREANDFSKSRHKTVLFEKILEYRTEKVYN